MEPVNGPSPDRPPVFCRRSRSPSAALRDVHVLGYEISTTGASGGDDARRDVDTPLTSMMRDHIARRAQRVGRLEGYRILHGEIDGAPPHWAVDRLASALIFRAPDETSVRAQANFIDRVMKITDGPAVLKIREGHQSRVLRGPIPEALPLVEGPARITVKLDDGYQTGIFVEGRALRNRITQDHLRGEVLSLFSYTGTASIRAALSGARVTSVDASRRAHAWARDNFTHSGLEADAHRWFVDDALTVLRRSPDDAWTAVILDPPAFGRAKRKSFKLARDLHALAFHALRSARRIYFSSHAPELADRVLRKTWEEAARRLGTSIAWKPVPNDFDLPEGGSDWGRYHRAIVVER